LVEDFKKKHAPKRAFETILKEDRLSDSGSKEEPISGKIKKKVKDDSCFNKNDTLNIDFPYKQVNSTESTNNGSAIDPA